MFKQHMEKSLFMQDSWRSNHGYEAMLDFQMSWLMRLAAEKSFKQERLHKISRQVLLRLIEEKGDRDVEVERVEVWRQWNSIDVRAEVDLVVSRKKEKHVVIIEDKAYTMIHDNQLERYKENVEEHYHNGEQIHYWVITFFNEEDNKNKYEALKQDCYNAKWGLLSFYEVIGWEDGENFEDTESDLFNEFWLREWY